MSAVSGPVFYRCAACQDLMRSDWSYCISCGTAPAVGKRAHPAPFYPTLRTRWGKMKWKELHGKYRDNLTVGRPQGIQGMKNSFEKMFFEGETAEPLTLEKDGEQELSIDITDRTVIQQDGEKRVLLENIRLNVHDGEMVLILGGSGAGKTTFLNAVMGTEPANAKITYAGIDLYQDYDKIKHFIGYVPQTDPLRMNDTVYMTLLNAAELKLPDSVVSNSRLLNERIEEVLKTVSLSDESNNIVSKLSGGQRKRLSIAAEYIANPHIFFLDEPDSGLDGSQARILMGNLRTIADSGKIVMVISHAPDRASALYDKVIVLAKDRDSGIGQLAFYGAVKDALKHFRAKTLEDIVAITET